MYNHDVNVMENVKDFINNITPSNYFITKSMEITKVNSSGTLWYTKKYLVLYDAIFLSKKIRTLEGINEIKNNFEKFISTLPDSQKEKATSFFFPEHADLRGDFKSYNEFAGNLRFSDNEREYQANVDKYYFVYLMYIGGQSGINKHIKEKLYQDDFVFTNLKNIISEYKLLHPDENINEAQAFSDYHAALRNERQILFYYGYFHSRNYGAGHDNEFASLTPIGELAVHSNSKEFAMIWEHQKLKLISQPVSVKFPAISNCSFCDVEKFKLNYSPYFTILKFLHFNKELSPYFYDRVLSRSNNKNYNDIIQNYKEYEAHIKAIESVITSFNLRSETQPEDFEKEIKKYMLGIRDDLKLDFKDNYFGCISSLKENSWKVTNPDKLGKIFSIYEEVEKYKLKNYSDLFIDCEAELKKKYLAEYSKSTYTMNHRIKMAWDLYNIRKDDVIMKSLLIADYIIYNNLSIENIDSNELYEYLNTNFNSILKSLNLSNRREIINSFKEIIERIRTKSLEEIECFNGDSIDKISVNKYSTLDACALTKKIHDVSEENILPKLERKRDSRIINLLNAYYLTNHSDENHLIKCECCGQTTFIKNNDEPYLEFHHLIPFSIANGPDHYKNIFGLCPMCHRKIHAIKDVYKNDLFRGFDINNHFQEDIFSRIKDLYNLNILKSYQLEYALSENMINEEEYNLILAR